MSTTMSGGQQEAYDWEQLQQKLASLDDQREVVCQELFDPMFGPVTVRPVVKLINGRLAPYGFQFVRTEARK